MESDIKSNTILRWLVKWLATTVAVYFCDWLLAGIHIDTFWTALWVALLLGLLNSFLKPILQLISLPLIVLTFGLFLLAINAIILLFIGEIVPEFKVDGFWWAVLGSLVISLVTYLIDPPKRKNGGNGDGNGGAHISVRRNP